MKKGLCAALISAGIAGLLHGADFDIGISGSDKGISGFSLSVGNYYRVPVQEIVVIERSIPHEEMSVVYFLARESRKSPRFITDLRHRGMSWWNISIRLGLDPHTLYLVDSHRHSGPPYGKAYGYQKEGKNYRLQDAEIVELVNVRFLSTYHGVSVDDVIDRRRHGEHFRDIDEGYRGKKDYQPEQMQYRDDRRQKAKHGDGNGDKHGHGKGDKNKER